MEKITIKQEIALLEYLYAMLQEGITTGVTEQEYFSFINNLVDKINSESKVHESVIPVRINEENFSEIANKAIKLATKEGDKPGILYKKTNNDSSIILPTYDLKRINCHITGHNNYRILSELLKETIQKINLSSYRTENVSENNLDVANKVAATYVNEAIRRYVEDRIEKGHWPSQCNDIDKYIFKQDIAKYIDENGTRDNFKKAYTQAIQVVCQLQDAAMSNDEIKFSNDKNNVLAYANYLKFFAPQELHFLKGYPYNRYIRNSTLINLSIKQNEVYYKTSKSIFKESYGIYGEEYESNEGTLGNAPVKIMKKRLNIKQ